MRGSGVDVYKNTEDGLADEGLSLRLRTPGGAAFTPQKALLARGEVRARLRCALLAVLSLKMHSRICTNNVPRIAPQANLLLLTPNTGATDRSHSVFQFGAHAPSAAAAVCMHACLARVLTQLAFRAPKRRH